MPRRAKGLTAIAVQKAKPGRYFDGDGLVLLVRSPDAKFWSLRYSQGGKLREMGLGPAAGRRAVTLAEARRKARDLFDLHKDGADPLASRVGGKAAAHANAILAPSFQKSAIDYIEAHRSSWSNQVHIEQWQTSLAEYVYPKIGQLPVSTIEVAHVVDVLLPIWETKRTTAKRIRGRIEKILGRAKVLKQRDGENPARWLENLDTLLPVAPKRQQQKHHPAMPYNGIGAFMAKLRAVDSVTARALEYTILTCARSNETRRADWSEIKSDEESGKPIWIVPADEIKGGKTHRVALCARAVAILEQMQEHRGDSALIFHAEGMQLTSDAMLRLLQRDMGYHDSTVHGFRSTFRDWAAELTNFAPHAAELALAHTVSDEVEAAYRRGDMLAKRFALSEAWSEFCAQPSRKAGNVTPIRRKRGAS